MIRPYERSGSAGCMHWTFMNPARSDRVCAQLVLERRGGDRQGASSGCPAACRSPPRNRSNRTNSPEWPGRLGVWICNLSAAECTFTSTSQMAANPARPSSAHRKCCKMHERQECESCACGVRAPGDVLCAGLVLKHVDGSQHCPPPLRTPTTRTNPRRTRSD